MNRPFSGEVANAILDELAHFSAAPAAFLYAWKRGISLSSDRYFGLGGRECFETASQLSELRPNLQQIEDDMDLMSSGQRVFIASLVSFADAAAGARLLRRAGVQGLRDLDVLDLQPRAVIAALILHNTRF